MSRNVLMLLGGAYHDFEGYKQSAEPVFGDAGYVVQATYEADDLLNLGENYAAVVVYTSLGGVTDPKGNVGTDLNEGHIEALVRYVTQGGGLFGVHSATVNGNPGNDLHTLFGGRFIDHPPMFNFPVFPMRLSHPVTEGIGEFSVFDEFYVQDVNDDVLVLMTAYDRGVCHPMVWTRKQGEGRVAYVAPGHDARAWSVPAFQKLTVQALDWVAKK